MNIFLFHLTIRSHSTLVTNSFLVVGVLLSSGWCFVVTGGDGHGNNNNNNNNINQTHPLTRITNHACFAKTSLDECYNSHDLDCLWCEYWCVQNRNDAARTEGCHEYSDELSEFYSKPQIIDVKPKIIFEATPTLINIYGSHLFDISEHVYNRINSVQFDHKYNCEIVHLSYNLIQCILDGFDHTVRAPFIVSMKYSFQRLVFDLDESNETEAEVSISILNPKQIKDKESENVDDKQNGTFGNIETLFGVTLGVCLSCLIFGVYLKRQLLKNVNEAIKRRFFFGRMRKELKRLDLYIEHRSIEYQNKLGEGNFGEVFSARVIDTKFRCFEVAVKRLRPGAEVDKMEQFISEGIRMSTFCHKRILSTMAIIHDRRNATPAIVLPIMKHGDLCRYLRQTKTLPLSQLTSFAYQISEGMKYLNHTMEHVHGDLAARNCLLDANMEIKIGDFGMSRHLYRADYVTINDTYRPIRWMALECLLERKPKFSPKSDVWSFGVVLWEIFTHGLYPYEEFDDVDLVKQLRAGHRLHRPYNCPHAIHQLMLDCWTVECEQRPTFIYIEQRLRDILAGDDVDNQDCGPSPPGWPQIHRLPFPKKETSYTTLAERFVVSTSDSKQHHNAHHTHDYYGQL